MQNEEIEALYCQSPFIKEVCVIGVGASGEGLHAIVVPDLETMRKRKIVNMAELIRFELEGLSLSLPLHTRVLGFDISLDPLPRTTTGKVARDQVARRAAAATTDAEEQAAVEPHVARVIEVVRDVVRPGVVVRPRSNLELDLGLDSMERVELLALLEQRLGMQVPAEVANSALVVSELAEAFRHALRLHSGQATGHNSEAGEAAWDVLLEVPNPGPELRELAKPRRVFAPLIFVLAWLLVRLLGRPRVSGLEQLPRRGPFIIAPNHQSYVDPFVLIGLMPYEVVRQLFAVGAAEYFQTPPTAWLARQLNLVPVDPDTNLVRGMQAGAYGLRTGQVLLLFPEGERSIDGGVKKFKKGAAILSRHLDTPIVPVAIAGVFEIWGRNRAIDWKLLLPWSGHRVRVAFGAPLQPGTDSYAEQTARLRRAVEEMWLKIASRN